ncbi:MAG: prolyl oligopeptidase family serine peptidase [Alphaproteobacteria bacterium]|uniref:Prolyl oligopeptidase family serine peptidase n=1 Tax=Candidatus Nitrobium versatile TaxID=2884831 RepID=A0A953M302_9BACT|nr:prolyl oligopeptidase family serine peptidase [Candidatus Nitrobium versatile]
MRKSFVFLTTIFILIGLALFLPDGEEEKQKVTLVKGREYETFSRLAKSPLKKIPDLRAWKKIVPEVTTIAIKSSTGQTNQPALFYDSGSARKKPLLLVLHSWSEDYRQYFSIPYGIWAVKNDWVFMHPDYRGAFTNPEATASETALRDILDAVEYAKKNARIDESRIYIAGFSGGAMATLIMVGRYPELWAGAVAWVPVYDLTEWYTTTRNARHGYARQIANSCGGTPLPGTKAARECRKRSPSTYLKHARGKNVPVYIAVGIDDRFVPPGHAIMAFNDLAAEEDRISRADIEYINARHQLPPRLSGEYSDTLYADAGVKLLFERESAHAVLKIFEGGHDVIYNAGLYWLSTRRKSAPAGW